MMEKLNFQQLLLQSYQLLSVLLSMLKAVLLNIFLWKVWYIPPPPHYQCLYSNFIFISNNHKKTLVTANLEW